MKWIASLVAILLLISAEAGTTWVYGTYTSFDPFHKDAGIVLSGENLIATASGSGGAVRSTNAVVDGRRGTATFTLTIGTGITAVGLVNASYVFGSNALGEDANSIGYYNDGHIHLNGAVIDSFATFNQGDTISIELTRSIPGSFIVTFRAGPSFIILDPIPDWGSAPIYGAAQLVTVGDKWTSTWANWNVP